MYSEAPTTASPHNASHGASTTLNSALSDSPSSSKVMSRSASLALPSHDLRRTSSSSSSTVSAGMYQSARSNSGSSELNDEKSSSISPRLELGSQTQPRLPLNGEDESLSASNAFARTNRNSVIALSSDNERRSVVDSSSRASAQGARGEGQQNPVESVRRSDGRVNRRIEELEEGEILDETPPRNVILPAASIASKRAGEPSLSQEQRLLGTRSGGEIEDRPSSVIAPGRVGPLSASAITSSSRYSLDRPGSANTTLISPIPDPTTARYERSRNEQHSQRKSILTDNLSFPNIEMHNARTPSKAEVIGSSSSSPVSRVSAMYETRPSSSYATLDPIRARRHIQSTLPLSAGPETRHDRFGSLSSAIHRKEPASVAPRRSHTSLSHCSDSRSNNLSSARLFPLSRFSEESSTPSSSDRRRIRRSISPDSSATTTRSAENSAAGNTIQGRARRPYTSDALHSAIYEDGGFAADFASVSAHPDGSTQSANGRRTAPPGSHTRGSRSRAYLPASDTGSSPPRSAARPAPRSYAVEGNSIAAPMSATPSTKSLRERTPENGQGRAGTADETNDRVAGRLMARSLHTQADANNGQNGFVRYPSRADGELATRIALLP